MTEYLTERSIEIRVRGDSPSLFGDISAAVDAQLLPGEFPIRFAVTESSGDALALRVGDSGRGGFRRFNIRIS